MCESRFIDPSNRPPVQQLVEKIVSYHIEMCDVSILYNAVL